MNQTAREQLVTWLTGQPPHFTPESLADAILDRFIVIPIRTDSGREGCCATWPKPCAYHEGYARAVDAITDTVAEFMGQLESNQYS